MAAEVPVCDVLCEAMEYLSKLGSNLRSRSENLKEKRISKNKLRNAHAIHKAAKKVLLICELSKKSLENVETGVRKVLSIVDAAQANTNIGGKTIDKKNQDDNKKFYYFNYDSFNLRISKKISINHFTCVKVLARGMPESMQEKYPVFYDCKLKRLRRKLSAKQTEEEIQRSSKREGSSWSSDTNQDIENSTKKCSKLVECDASESGKTTDFDKTKTVRRKSLDSNPADVNDDETNATTSDSLVKQGHNSEQGANEQNNANSKSKGSQETTNLKEDFAVSELIECFANEAKVVDDRKERKKEATSIRKKFSKIRIADDSSESDEALQNKHNNKSLNKNEFSTDKENEANKNNTTDSEPKSKKRKLGDTGDSSKPDDSDHNSTEANNSENDSKPLIRCVNITKLLKPDILNTNSKSKGNQITKSNHLMSKGRVRKNSTNCMNAQKENSTDRRRNRHMDNKDDEFWELKRNEVKQFQPKQFTVNINRLPKLNINYLLLHSLQKITHGSNTICEVKKAKHKETDNLVKNIDDVKNALLNESESEDIDNALSAEVNKLKNTLLNDSDSDAQVSTSKNTDNSNQINQEALTDTAAIKDALLNESDSENNEHEKIVKNKNIDKAANDSEKELAKEVAATTSKNTDNSNQINQEALTDTAAIKDALLNESDSENNGHEKIVKNKTIVRAANDSEKEIAKEVAATTAKNTDNSNQINQEALTDTAAIKDALLNESDSENNGHESDSENNGHVKIVKNKTIDKAANDSEKELAKEVAATTSKNTDNSNQINQEALTDTAAIKDALLNESDSENNGHEKIVKNKTVEKAANDSEKEVAEEIKSVLLNDSDSDKNQNDNTVDKPDKSAKEKNISQNQSDKTEQCELTQDPEKIKSSLLNDSSESEAEPVLIKMKMSKPKRKHVIKSMDAKKSLLRYSSSSENEEEDRQESDKDFQKHTHKHTRRKSRILSSSLNEENEKKPSSQESDSQDKSSKTHSDIDGKDSRTIDQIDGTVDEHSNSSVSQMVRSKAKPSGSSGHNSDNQDSSDKEIDGLTNLNSLNKPHRRRDPSKNNSGSRSAAVRKSSRSKPTPNIGEDLLRAVSSSDGSEDDNIEEEDLPPVTLAGLNGDSISHLARDDLLGESDSSESHKDEKSEPEQTHTVEDSDEEENVKLKRQRKANAISSDSESGTSRRKQRDEDVRLSDFEDSEDESSEAKKRAKRKKGSESDGSVRSSNEGGTKKRRRIRSERDSDASGSDTENEGRNKHGRKNIRKVMGKNQLEEATKKAAREEKERVARILERQKVYNNLQFDESGKPDEVTLEKVVLDFDPETKEPLIEVDRGLVKKLKPHQANGIKFMWDASFESVKRIKKDRGSGCILAHCMGLGKTLQVISLTHTLLIHGDLTGVNRVLVVCPLSTVLNWVNEIKMWLKHAHSDFEVDVYELSRYKQNSERAYQLQQWFEGGGVCVLGYEMFRNLSADNNKKFKKKMLRSFQEALVDPGPDLVVCDEGHLLKNEKTSLSQSMNRVKTRRRIVLTGTPLQNNLKEYYCMVQFVKPNLLGKYNEYLNRFVNPITNGQYTDSTEGDIKVMKRRSHVLHKMLDGAVQRRDYGVLAPFLPPKHEYVLFITLSDVQVKLYQHYLDNYSRRPLPGRSSGFLFPDFQSLQRIWTHPLVLKYNSERYEIMQQKKRDREEEDSEGSLVDFIDDDSTPDETSTDESSDDLSDVSDDSRKKSKKKNKAKKKDKAKDKSKEDSKVGGIRRGTRANPADADDEDADVAEVVEVRTENPTEWWIKLIGEEELDDMRNSHKLVLLFDILRQCEAIGDKLLVFSQSLYSLDLIEHFLGKVDDATQEGRIDEKLGKNVGSWSPGVDYFRLDGSTSCENRSLWCKNFNREDNPRARLFLISTRAGGLGINLVAANRVVIFDVSWNPSHDVQSIFRIYRFGQKKPCYVYRFLAMGTMEEKIYERQVTKQAISKRVIDEQQIDRHYAENDLAELYTFEPRPEEPRAIPALPKDRLFAEMLREHEAQIYKYHEHDSLLENKEEETLSEEERKAAWEDFENEKNKPPPAPFPSTWPMHNGMVPGLLAQQQQQLAYAALAAMLRKDMPNINDNQIRDMLPLIYNSNPGLMQKMSEIYKYTQPGMMNHGMMNPAMSQAGAAGGSSGLQYEPPWQRQQQQQQQMRLQQLMQHNQMGAKMYAGGLGSRDPVAMALQQQRAREIMLGGGAGRPRGRPPLAPRQAPAPPQDVVNLDSD